MPDHGASRGSLTLADVWTWFADTSCGEYSPLYDRICRAVAASDDVLALVGEAPPAGHQPNVLLGAVHYLLLGGLDHPLGDVYAGRSDADPAPLFVDLCLDHRAEILELLATRHTNTNEVGRSALVGPALTLVADRLGAPLGLIDVGCSAGLNLLCDRYRLDYGDAGVTGPPGSLVRIDCAVRSGRPPIAPMLPPIDVCIGIDLDPINIDDADERRWLLACTWPDTGRLERTRAALDLARRDPPSLIAGDAPREIGPAVRAMPEDLTPVVTTTWVLAYLQAAQRVAFREALADASAARPVAFISAEGAGVVDLFADVDAPRDASGTEPSVLGLVTFRRGAIDAVEPLALVHPHGLWMDWRA